MSEKKILIVEDEILIAKQIQLILEKSGYKIIGMASSGKDALGLASSDQPNVILMDINLKGNIDGIETAIQLRKTLDVPIIFLSAFTDDATTDRAKAVNPYAYISKPFKEKDLLIGIKMAIHKYQMENNHLAELKNENVKLQQISEADSLTEISNRRKFDNQSVIEWNRALRDNRNISVIMIDIDHFKNYNDAYGHQAGDECLKMVAKSLQDSLKRGGELLSRYGGEEFAAILPGSDIEEARIVGEQLRKTIEDLKIQHKDSPTSEYVTLSLGICSVIPDKENSLKDLIAGADKALYKSKSSGRNMVSVE